MGSRNQKNVQSFNGLDAVNHQEVMDRIRKFQSIKKRIAETEGPTEELRAEAENELFFIINSIIRYIRLKATSFHNKHFGSFRDDNMSVVQYQDVVNAGIIGAIRAIERFDVDRGHHLLTYAWPYIRSHFQTLRNSAYEVPAYAFSSPEGNDSPAFIEWGTLIKAGGAIPFSEVGEFRVEGLHYDEDDYDRLSEVIDGQQVALWLYEFLSAFPILSDYPKTYREAIKDARSKLYRKADLHRDGRIVWSKLFDDRDEYIELCKELKVSQPQAIKIFRDYMTIFREFLNQIGFDYDERN